VQFARGGVACRCCIDEEGKTPRCHPPNLETVGTLPGKSRKTEERAPPRSRREMARPKGGGPPKCGTVSLVQKTPRHLESRPRRRTKPKEKDLCVVAKKNLRSGACQQISESVPRAPDDSGRKVGGVVVVRPNRSPRGRGLVAGGRNPTVSPDLPGDLPITKRRTSIGRETPREKPWRRLIS